MGKGNRKGMTTSRTAAHRRHWWIIAVSGYGEFAFFGTAQVAEQMRAHKANWEGGVGTKRLALPTNEDRWLIALERKRA